MAWARQGFNMFVAKIALTIAFIAWVLLVATAYYIRLTGNFSSLLAYVGFGLSCAFGLSVLTAVVGVIWGI